MNKNISSVYMQTAVVTENPSDLFSSENYRRRIFIDSASGGWILTGIINHLALFVQKGCTRKEPNRMQPVFL